MTWYLRFLVLSQLLSLILVLSARSIPAESLGSRLAICRRFFSKNGTNSPHIDISFDDICAHPLLLVHGFHGSGTTWVTSLLRQERNGGLDVIGFSPPGCQRHLGRGFDPEQTPKSCTGAPMDEGEWLQNLWPRFTTRLSNLSRWCPSCASSTGDSAASILACAYQCPDNEKLALSSSLDVYDRFQHFRERNNFWGECICNGNPGVKRPRNECPCQRNNFTVPSAAMLILREFQYFWGIRSTRKSDRSIVLLSKTPDMNPGLLLRALPGATVVLAVLRHPYFVMRCHGISRHSQSNSKHYAQDTSDCVRMWRSGMAFMRSRLDSDSWRAPYALLRYEDAVASKEKAEQWLAPCVLHVLLGVSSSPRIIEDKMGKNVERQLWGIHANGAGSGYGNSSHIDYRSYLWGKHAPTFDAHKSCKLEHTCLEFLHSLEPEFQEVYGYSLLNKSKWSTWSFQPRLLLRSAEAKGSEAPLDHFHCSKLM